MDCGPLMIVLDVIFEQVPRAALPSEIACFRPSVETQEAMAMKLHSCSAILRGRTLPSQARARLAAINIRCKVPVMESGQ